MTARQAMTVSLIAAALIGAAAAYPEAGHRAVRRAITAAWFGGGCWNKPVLPDWCEFDGHRPASRS
jgi:hypothetical protein